MKRIVSISLGSSKRDKESRATLLGHDICFSRIGTDGDLSAFARKFEELDGTVDAIGIGGADRYLWIGNRRYAFRQIEQLISGAKKTPVVDGSGLKNTLEKRMIWTLDKQRTVDFAASRVFLLMAVDRFGMAQALAEVCPNVVYGDLMFGLGLPLRLRSYRVLSLVGRVLLPIVTKLPFKWFYPTGKSQEARKPKFKWAFDEADVICGDWHYIRRHCPEALPGKTIITNTLRKMDLEFLRRAGARRAITSTPEIEGESFGTNVMEAAVVAILGKRPEYLTSSDYDDALDKLGWQPNVFEL